MTDKDAVPPEAYVVHRTSTRLRIKVPSRKGEESYFVGLGETLAGELKPEGLEVNPATGSVLMMQEDPDTEALSKLGLAKGLFRLQPLEEKMPLSKKMVKPLGEMSSSVKRFSAGEIDLPGMAFLALLCAGVVQILRGNFRSPPWYTAFWYAMGIFTKSIMEKEKQDAVDG